MKIAEARARRPLPAPPPSVVWWKAPVYSRGRFSPRLLMAWGAAGYTVRVIEHWLAARPVLLGAVVVPVPDTLPLVLGLLSLIGLLLGLGTVQTAVLGDAAPAPGLATTDPPPPEPASE